MLFLSPSGRFKVCFSILLTSCEKLQICCRPIATCFFAVDVIQWCTINKSVTVTLKLCTS